MYGGQARVDDATDAVDLGPLGDEPPDAGLPGALALEEAALLESALLGLVGRAADRALDHPGAVRLRLHLSARASVPSALRRTSAFSS